MGSPSVGRLLLRDLVVSAVQSSAEYVDVDVADKFVTIRDNGTHRCCPAVLRPGQTQAPGVNPHATCGVNPMLCKQASRYQHAATSLGRAVIMICSEADTSKVVLWRRPKMQAPVQVVSQVTFKLVPKEPSGDMSDAYVEDWELQPSEPSAPEEWQQALNAICSALPEGRTQLESLVRRTGAQASCLHIMELNDAFQIRVSPGSVLLLAPGPNPPTPPTPSGRVLVELRAYLGMLLINPSAALSLQGEGVSELHPTNYLTTGRQEFGPVPVQLGPTKPGVPPVTVNVSLVLGYDGEAATTSQDEFGIHVYVRDTLVDTFFKVPAMIPCALPGSDKRVLGVATITNLKELPQPGFLRRDRSMRPLQQRLDGWVDSYLKQQQRLAGVKDEDMADGQTVGSGYDDGRSVKRQRTDGGAPGPVLSTGGAATTSHTSGGVGATHTHTLAPPHSSASSSQLMGLGNVTSTAGNGPMRDKTAVSSGARTKPAGRTLRGPGRWQLQMQEVIEHVMGYHRANGVFNTPVDPVKLNIPDYFTVIPRPMDFGTVMSQLKNDVYTHYTQVLEHLLLVLDNCCRYNPPTNDFHTLAMHVEQVLLKKVEPMLSHLANLAEQDPPQEPLPEHEHLHVVDLAAGPPPDNYPGVWPPVGQVTSEQGLPLAAVRPYTYEGAEAVMRNVQKRIEKAFGSRRGPGGVLARGNSFSTGVTAGAISPRGRPGQSTPPPPDLIGGIGTRPSVVASAAHVLKGAGVMPGANGMVGGVGGMPQRPGMMRPGGVGPGMPAGGPSLQPRPVMVRPGGGSGGGASMGPGAMGGGVRMPHQGPIPGTGAPHTQQGGVAVMNRPPGALPVRPGGPRVVTSASAAMGAGIGVRPPSGGGAAGVNASQLSVRAVLNQVITVVQDVVDQEEEGSVVLPLELSDQVKELPATLRDVSTTVNALLAKLKDQRPEAGTGQDAAQTVQLQNTIKALTARLAETEATLAKRTAEVEEGRVRAQKLQQVHDTLSRTLTQTREQLASEAAKTIQLAGEVARLRGPQRVATAPQQQQQGPGALASASTTGPVTTAAGVHSASTGPHNGPNGPMAHKQPPQHAQRPPITTTLTAQQATSQQQPRPQGVSPSPAAAIAAAAAIAPRASAGPPRALVGGSTSVPGAATGAPKPAGGGVQVGLNLAQRSSSNGSGGGMGPVCLNLAQRTSSSGGPGNATTASSGGNGGVTSSESARQQAAALRASLSAEIAASGDVARPPLPTAAPPEAAAPAGPSNKSSPEVAMAIVKPNSGPASGADAGASKPAVTQIQGAGAPVQQQDGAPPPPTPAPAT